MLFHITFHVAIEQRDATLARFKQTGGLPPAGVTMLGRWHGIGGRVGFSVVEAADPQAVAKWLQDWTDLISFEVTPVLTDEQFSQVVA
jgi:uncharacterized protein DUF3303